MSTRLDQPPEKWNFFWACRYGFGFRLWLIELQVYWYKPGGFGQPEEEQR